MALIDKYTIATENSGNNILIIPNLGVTALAPFNCSAMQPLAFRTPLTGWINCNVTFRVQEACNIAPTNAQLYILDDGTATGNLYLLPTVAGRYYPLPPQLFNAVSWINIVCSVAQTGDQTINLILAPLWQGIHS